jgi:hypothetical protein
MLVVRCWGGHWADNRLNLGDIPSGATTIAEPAQEYRQQLWTGLLFRTLFLCLVSGSLLEFICARGG